MPWKPPTVAPLVASPAGTKAGTITKPVPAAPAAVTKPMPGRDPALEDVFMKSLGKYAALQAFGLTNVLLGQTYKVGGQSCNCGMKQCAICSLGKMKKQSAIFGAREPELDVDSVPFDVRQRMMQRYLGEKGREQPTGYMTPMAIGGAAGGVLGGLAGHLSGGGRISSGAGALGGASLGSMLGAILAHSDKTNISQAAKMMGASPEELQEHMHRQIAAQRAAREFSQQMTGANRHEEHMQTLRDTRGW